MKSERVNLSSSPKQVDRDRSGFIDAQELQQALALGNLNFSTAMCAQMIRLHDRNMSGRLDLQQFAQLHYFLVKMQQLFVSLDQDRNGRLSRPEFANALQTAGYRLDAPVLDRVGQTFDPARSGSWGLAEWLACTVFLESAQVMRRKSCAS